ncbi:hypothetical protein SRABI128_04192 [Microbacterium sp. Bi128]|nr:hypothetical protein SRABI128_04192 [Microbacterium sp. Bi128]
MLGLAEQHEADAGQTGAQIVVEVVPPSRANPVPHGGRLRVATRAPQHPHSAGEPVPQPRCGVVRRGERAIGPRPEVGRDRCPRGLQCRDHSGRAVREGERRPGELQRVTGPESIVAGRIGVGDETCTDRGDDPVERALGPVPQVDERGLGGLGFAVGGVGLRRQVCQHIRRPPVGKCELALRELDQVDRLARIQREQRGQRHEHEHLDARERIEVVRGTPAPVGRREPRRSDDGRGVRGEGTSHLEIQQHHVAAFTDHDVAGVQVAVRVAGVVQVGDHRPQTGQHPHRPLRVGGTVGVGRVGAHPRVARDDLLLQGHAVDTVQDQEAVAVG